MFYVRVRTYEKPNSGNQPLQRSFGIFQAMLVARMCFNIFHNMVDSKFAITLFYAFRTVILV